MSFVSFGRSWRTEASLTTAGFFCFPVAAGVCTVLYPSVVVASFAVGLRPAVLWWVPICLCICCALSLGTRAVLGSMLWLRAGFEGACIICVLGLSLACLSYVCATAGLPLWDDRIIAADGYLHFNWLTAARAVDNAPFLLTLLNAAYATFTGQLIVTAVLLLAAGRVEDLDRYLITFVCASLLAEGASLLTPTLGPASTVASGAMFDHLSAIGRTTANIVVALRSRTLTVIDARALDGIISFPSLHAAVALLIPYHLRWSKPLCSIAVGINALMFLAAIPCGNHYLLDVLAGLLVAMLAIPAGASLYARLANLAPFQTARLPRRDSIACTGFRDDRGRARSLG
jgi:membrane-associated phospholipid phosphatase